MQDLHDLGTPYAVPPGITVPHLPRRLVAPPPGWVTTADVIVVGSGIAGLNVALSLRQQVDKVLLVTKTVLSEGSTQWAQGGIAAALAPEDSPDAHLVDTLVAGVGLCDEDAVRALVEEGPSRVHELIDLGAQFDTDTGGRIKLTREGGHGMDRIAHAGGDATGAEISRALIAQLHAVLDDPGIEVIEHALVVDLLQDDVGRVCGVTLHVIGEGEINGIGAGHARAVVLASGGLGQIYSATTNPSVATGDGMAMCLRAGAVMGDLEFVQFHPTVLWLGPGSSGQQPLISEAVRGEGAFLVDVNGERFMPGIHPQGDLAPRDVVSRAIVARMEQTGADHVLLDCRHLGEGFLLDRFPGITRRLRELGFDPATQLIPVAPAQHYASGGVRTDLRGRTSLEGLYACGEVSCTGVHGANRLASNSLLEGLVFARRVADDLASRLARDELPPTRPTRLDGAEAACDAHHRVHIQAAMTRGAGAVRSAASLRATAEELVAHAALPATEAGPGPQTWETTNLLHLGQALTLAAALREETRGGHLRSDFPHARDAWRGHLHLWRREDGTLEVAFAEVPEQPVVTAALAEIAGHEPVIPEPDSPSHMTSEPHTSEPHEEASP